jgi:hypothetical protein
MRGPCKNGSPYYSYVKATGQSKKDNDAGEVGLGSFGIGKFAPFANSTLRTIFVSTVFADKGGSGHTQYTQGKALLMSHNDDAGETRQNIGYWGVRQSCMPVEGIDSKLPGWLQQASKPGDLGKNLGTTVHVIGFQAAKDWENKLTASVIENFFGAIWKGTLVVEVGATKISRESISELFESKVIRDSLEGMTGQPESFDNSKCYFSTFVATEEVFIQDQENRELGNCEMRIVLSEAFPKRVAILRNGMLITDQLDRLKRFGDFKEFAAVIECQSKKGNELLRDMEPPKHNSFEPELLSSEDKPRGQRAIIQLAQWARDMLKRHARDPVSEISDVRELAAYFADVGEEEGGSKGEEVNPIGKIDIRAQPLRRRPVVIQTDEEGNEGGTGQRDPGDGGGGGGKGVGAGQGQGKGGSGRKADKIVELNNVRSVLLSGKRRRVAATPAFSGTVELVVYEAGADTDRRLNIIKSSAGKIRSGIVRNLNAKRGSRFTIEVELDAAFYGAMKVAAYAI